VLRGCSLLRLVQRPPWPMDFYALAMLVLLLAFASRVDGMPKANQAEKPLVVGTVHAVNAAESADQAQQAAVVAKNAAEHSHFVAREASAALRYTQDALRQAGVQGVDVDVVGRAAEELESEAGLKAGSGSHATAGPGGPGEYRHLEYELERLEHDYDKSENGQAPGSVRDGFEVGEEDLDRLAKGGTGGDTSGTGPFEIDSEVVPYPNSVEPFGREGTARDLTESSVHESDGMIDQIEKAQAIESKRAVFRSLTKLRGATIASYDGIAKAHLKNVEDYAAAHKWRQEHVIHHLAEEEGDVEAWAFPKRAKTEAPEVAAAPAPVVPNAPFSS